MGPSAKPWKNRCAATEGEGKRLPRGIPRRAGQQAARAQLRLPHAANDVITIFDAEDDLHGDIFNVVNTIMLDERVKIVQAGVQLMVEDGRL